MNRGNENEINPTRKSWLPYLRNMKLAVLFLKYDRGGNLNSFEIFKSYADQLKGCNKFYIIIDNAKEGDHFAKIDKNIYRIDGDNSCWEFSGWQKGLACLRDNKFSYDAVLFANDAFLAYGRNLIEHPQTLNIKKWFLTGNSMMGQIDTKGYHMEIRGNDVSSWICTNCFFLTKRIIDAIGSVVSVNDENMKTVVSIDCPVIMEEPDHRAYFNADCGLNDNYKTMVVTWLTKEWHSKFDINEVTWALFRCKVRSLLNESLLTARIRNLGYKIESYKNYIDEQHESKKKRFRNFDFLRIFRIRS
jgi:hypothetical protein